MLRAALIGFPSSGKTTLFQLMTSAKDAPRGKGDVNIGISRVPDARLDVLTGMYNPRKRVPATVEFTDLVAPPRAGAQGLVDVAAYKNADALVHVVRAFRDPSIAHPSGSVNPARDAQAMEDELILADLGIAERRLERIEKDLKRGKSAELDKERELVQRCKTALEEGKPLRSLGLTGDDQKRLSGFQFLSAKPLLLVINLDEQDLGDVGADTQKAAAATGLTGFLAHAETKAVALCAKIELEISQLDAADATGLPVGAGTGRIRSRSRHPHHATTCSGTCRSSPSVRTSVVPGRSIAGRRRNSPRARFTATSSADSSEPRSWPTTR